MTEKLQNDIEILIEELNFKGTGDFKLIILLLKFGLSLLIIYFQFISEVIINVTTSFIKLNNIIFLIIKSKEN